VRLWLVPLTGLLVGLGLAIGALALDSASGYDLVSQTLTGTPTAASSLLATIITSNITLLSVVLTVMTTESSVMSDVMMVESRLDAAVGVPVSVCDTRS